MLHVQLAATSLKKHGDLITGVSTVRKACPQVRQVAIAKTARVRRTRNSVVPPLSQPPPSRGYGNPMQSYSCAD